MSDKKEKYDGLLLELESEESDLEILSKDCIDIASKIKVKLDVYLDPVKSKPQTLFNHGMPEAIMSYTKLMSSAMDAKQKKIAVKKMKMDIIKNNTEDDDGIDIF